MLNCHSESSIIRNKNQSDILEFRTASVTDLIESHRFSSPSHRDKLHGGRRHIICSCFLVWCRESFQAYERLRGPHESLLNKGCYIRTGSLIFFFFAFRWGWNIYKCLHFCFQEVKLKVWRIQVLTPHILKHTQTSDQAASHSESQDACYRLKRINDAPYSVFVGQTQPSFWSQLLCYKVSWLYLAHFYWVYCVCAHKYP